MISPILSLCARVDGHLVQRRLLERACDGFTEWDNLLLAAESHGMAPLLHRHLLLQKEQVPDTFLRGLRFLCLRHQQANHLLMENLLQIQSLLKQHTIPSLILKGGALCHTVYPDIGLRPMRDLDILLTKEDAVYAHNLLQRHGFVLSTEKTPQGYYHLPALLKNQNGMLICVELHHGLFPDDPPYYQQLSFDDLCEKSQVFEVDGTTAYSLGTEDMLYHLYQHGFHAPLTFEPYKFISLADIISLVEQKADEIDWAIMEKRYPQVIHALSLFHHLTPWSEAVLEKVPFQIQDPLANPGKPYCGWPRYTFSKKSFSSRIEVVQETIVPGKWWLMLYYGANGLLSLTFCLIVRHPLHLLRWLKLYTRQFLEKKSSLEQTEAGEKSLL